MEKAGRGARSKIVDMSENSLAGQGVLREKPYWRIKPHAGEL